MNPSKNQLVIAGTVRPPAKKSEIIEALVIRRREQLVKEREAAVAEHDALKKKFQVVAAEEMRAGGEICGSKYCSETYNYTSHDKDGRVTISDITCQMSVKPSAELTEIGRRIHRLRQVTRRDIPCTTDLKNEIRAELNQHTPTAVRVATLLKDPQSLKAIDALLARLDRSPVPAISV